MLHNYNLFIIIGITLFYFLKIKPIKASVKISVFLSTWTKRKVVEEKVFIINRLQKFCTKFFTWKEWCVDFCFKETCNED